MTRKVNGRAEKNSQYLSNQSLKFQGLIPIGFIQSCAMMFLIITIALRNHSNKNGNQTYPGKRPQTVWSKDLQKNVTRAGEREREKGAHR